MQGAELLQAVASLYEMVIVFLIALLALVAGLVYISIKTSSRRQIEEQFQKDFESDWLQSRLKDKVAAETRKSISDLSLQISKIELAVKQISARDPTQERIEETQIVSGN